MKKTFILDTNVLLSDANSIFSFGDNDVVLPFMVLEELDRHKDRQDEVGRNAREIARKIAEITKESKDLYKGVSLGDNKGILRILSIEQAAKRKEILSLPAELAESDNSGDNTIVKFCLNFQNAQPSESVVFITRDVLLRIKAEALLINVEDYTKFNVVKDPESLYSGVTTITNVDVEDFYSNEDFQLSEEVIKENDLKPNQFVILKNEAIGKSAVARFVNGKKPLRELKKTSMGKISPRNKEQEFAVDLLFDNDIKLVTLVGQAGSGKSLIALAAGLEQVIGSHKKYKSLVVCRPMLSVGKEVGFLPGDLSEKLEPWMAPIKDNLRFILSDGGKKPKAVEETLHLMFENGIIEVQALSFIRGRTIPNAYILVDECFPYNQNILLASGKKIKIGTLVRNFKKENKTEVMTYNEETKTFEPKEIIAVKSNGIRELVKVTMGNREVWVTDNHKFLTRDNSWQRVKDLKVGDIIMASEHSEHQMMQDLSEDQEQVIYGSFLGDGYIGCHGKNRYRLSVIHSDKQANYCLWKSAMFEDSRIENIKENGYSKKPATRFTTKMFATSVNYPLNKGGEIPKEILEKIDARGLAIWFMDDGNTNIPGYNHATIWTSSFSYQDNMKIIKMLKERFDINASLSEKTVKDEYYRLNLKSKDFYKLSELVSPWVHEELSYKIHPDHRKNINSKNWDVKKTWKKNKVFVIDALDFTNTKKEEVFDIEVKDNHNFIACSTSNKSRGGFIAHNCQNLSGHELKTILTRAGEGSKIVLTGDIEQIDAMYLDSVSNGLTIAIEKFKHHSIAGHITLTKCERSELASISAKILA
jgi:PhoH-like ATPase